MRGRPPKPIERHKLEGTHRPDRQGEGVAAPAGRPEPTIALGQYAQEMWDRLIPVLESMGVLTLADGQLCTAFCVNYGKWRSCEEHIEAEGMWQVDDRGKVSKHPAVLVAKESDERMEKLGAKMGLSPSERARLKVGSDNVGDAFAAKAFAPRKERKKPDLKAVK